MPRLYRFTASRLGGEPELVSDIVQSALCKAIDRLESYRGESALLSWLIGFCRFEMMSHLKKKKVTPITVEVLEENPDVRRALESLGEPLDPEQATQSNELADSVYRVLDQLPERQGSALEWKYCQGLSVDEIAARLETTTKAAESLLSRARAGFREVFASLEGDAGR